VAEADVHERLFPGHTLDSTVGKTQPVTSRSSVTRLFTHTIYVSSWFISCGHAV